MGAHAHPLDHHGDQHGEQAGDDEREPGGQPHPPEAVGHVDGLQHAQHQRQQHGRGHRRQQAQGFDGAASDFHARPGAVGAVLAAVGGDFDAAHALWRAAPPVGAGLGLLRGGGEHRDQGILRQFSSRPGDAGVAHEGASADFRVAGEHPAAAELVAADQGVVGEESAVFDLGELGHHDRGGNLDVAADLRAQGAEPQRGQLAGVEREEVGAGVVKQPDDGPQSPALGGAHREHARPQTERDHAHAEPRHGHVGGERQQRAERGEQHRAEQRVAAGRLQQPDDQRHAQGEGDQRLQGQADRRRAVEHDPVGTPRRVGVREAVLGTADLRRGRTRPAGTGLDGLVPGDGGAGLHVGPFADDGARQQV